MSDLPCPCGLKMIDKCDCRFPYRHHGPSVHGSKLADYLISEIALAEMVQAGEEDGLLNEATEIERLHLLLAEKSLGEKGPTD